MLQNYNSCQFAFWIANQGHLILTTRQKLTLLTIHTSSKQVCHAKNGRVDAIAASQTVPMQKTGVPAPLQPASAKGRANTVKNVSTREEEKNPRWTSVAPLNLSKLKGCLDG